jgi:hypothetical protein
MIRRSPVLPTVLIALAACHAGPSPLPATATTGATPDAAVAPTSSSSPGDPWPSDLEGRMLSFGSLEEAVEFLRAHMSAPILLPRSMPFDIRPDPHGTVLLATEGGVRAAQLNLIFGRGGKGHLIVQYGVSRLDGCASEHSVAVRVGALDGRLRESPGPWSELIWPATFDHPQGTLGLTGSLAGSRILEMARSMTSAPRSQASDVGC